MIESKFTSENEEYCPNLNTTVAVVLNVTRPNRTFLLVNSDVKELKTVLVNERVAWKLDSPWMAEEVSSMKAISHVELELEPPAAMPPAV